MAYFLRVSLKIEVGYSLWIFKIHLLHLLLDGLCVAGDKIAGGHHHDANLLEHVDAHVVGFLQQCVDLLSFLETMFGDEGEVDLGQIFLQVGRLDWGLRKCGSEVVEFGPLHDELQLFSCAVDSAVTGPTLVFDGMLDQGREVCEFFFDFDLDAVLALVAV